MSVSKNIGGLSIETTMYYDEHGDLVKEVDENKELGKHNYRDALRFLEKEKWIDIESGNGRKRFSLDYEKERWYITLLSQPWNGNTETYYKVDANSMQIIKKK